MKNNITLIFDADDTLWENQLYFNKFTTFFKNLILELNLNEKETMDTLLKFDTESYKRHEFGNVYYKESMKKTLDAFKKGNKDLYQEIEIIHDKLFNHPPVLFEGVKETIENLKNNNFRLFILTKGYYPVQNKKIVESGLENFFEAIIITTRKLTSTYENIIKMYNLDKNNSYMIGNSPKSDIIPALEAGLKTIYIPSHTVWELEDTKLPENNEIIHLQNFSELIEVFKDV